MSAADTLPMSLVPCAGPRLPNPDNHVEGTGRQRTLGGLRYGFDEQAGYNIDATRWLPLGGTWGDDSAGKLIVIGETWR